MTPPNPTSLMGEKRRASAMDDREEEPETGPSTNHRQLIQPRQRKAPARPAAITRAIPRCYEECDEADRRLIDQRECGMSWAEIKVEWEKLTGDVVAMSTLPNRYIRLKENFTGVEPEDHPRLLEAKREIEHAFDKEKWNLIAHAVEQKGGGKYESIDLRREYKKLMHEQAACIPPPGIIDPDFDITGHLESGNHVDVDVDVGVDVEVDVDDENEDSVDEAYDKAESPSSDLLGCRMDPSTDGFDSANSWPERGRD